MDETRGIPVIIGDDIKKLDCPRKILDVLLPFL
jgi:hypothetical protein